MISVSWGTPNSADFRPFNPIRAIAMEVAEKYGVTLAELFGKGRARKLGIARQEGYWRARSDLGASMPKIARAFHRADHSTVWHGIKAHAKRMGITADESKLFLSST